jgi:hypothetical protein
VYKKKVHNVKKKNVFECLFPENAYFQSESACFLTVVGVNFNVSKKFLYMHPSNTCTLLIFLYTAFMEK